MERCEDEGRRKVGEVVGKGWRSSGEMKRYGREKGWRSVNAKLKNIYILKIIIRKWKEKR